MDLKLDRPLAVFDIESTGINRRADRIIDLAIVMLHPGGERTEHTYRVNPGMPIPPGSTEVHGITDEDVKDAPPFEKVAPGIRDLLSNCDLGGFNVLHFDIPLLCEEFRRAGIDFDMEGRRVLDAQRIYHKKEPRDLTAALHFYCGEMHLDAHGALSDVLATIRVVEGQFRKYGDLPRELDALEEFCNPRNPEWVDRTGKIVWDGDGEAAINFGKHQGKKLRDLARLESSFLEWMLRSDFPRDTLDIVENALREKFPSRS